MPGQRPASTVSQRSAENRPEQRSASSATSATITPTDIKNGHRLSTGGAASAGTSIHNVSTTIPGSDSDDLSDSDVSMQRPHTSMATQRPHTSMEVTAERP